MTFFFFFFPLHILICPNFSSSSFSPPPAAAEGSSPHSDPRPAKEHLSWLIIFIFHFLPHRHAASIASENVAFSSPPSKQNLQRRTQRIRKAARRDRRKRRPPPPHPLPPHPESDDPGAGDVRRQRQSRFGDLISSFSPFTSGGSKTRAC